MQKLLLIALLFLTGCKTLPGSPSVAPAKQKAALPDLGMAPELTNEVWLNTNAPLLLAELRGKVILLEMWTFG